MALAQTLARYGHALGRWQAAWRFASPELRHAVSLAQISAAWDTFRRDAGPGDVGPAHERPIEQAGITSTEDPRRDGLLLWLADRASPAIADAAQLLCRMVGAVRPFGPDEQELLQAARDTLIGDGRPRLIAHLLPATGDDAKDVIASLRSVAAALDRLRTDPTFLESTGAEVRHRLPGGTISHYVPAEPAAAWALNLALFASGSTLPGTPLVPGLVSRALFRADAEPEELACALIDGCSAALAAAFDRMEAILPELARGHAALSHMSRNSRTRDAWLLLAALRSLTRAQLARGLALSRAGTDIQARTLADVGLASLRSAGRVDWQQQRPTAHEPAPLDDGPLSDAAAELDATMADVDRLLARTTR